MTTLQQTINNDSPSLLKTGWWVLTEAEKLKVLQQLPKQDAWTFNAFRVNEFCWEFDLPEANTYGELLVGGTNQSLDEHYELLTGSPVGPESAFQVTASIKPFEDETTRLIKLRDDTDAKLSGTYLDITTGLECWLCPFVSVLWDNAPIAIYLNLEVLN